MGRPKKGEGMTTEERMKLLVENHTKYLRAIMLSFANDYSELKERLEAEAMIKRRKDEVV